MVGNGDLEIKDIKFLNLTQGTSYFKHFGTCIGVSGSREYGANVVLEGDTKNYTIQSFELEKIHTKKTNIIPNFDIWDGEDYNDRAKKIMKYVSENYHTRPIIIISACLNVNSTEVNNRLMAAVKQAGLTFKKFIEFKAGNFHGDL
jgi:hypothetical protein